MRIELLMRNIEKVSQLLGVVEPEKVSKSSCHQHFEGDEVALAKFLMKEHEKPGKFLLPHGIILQFGVFAFSWRIIPKAFRIKTPWESQNYLLTITQIMRNLSRDHDLRGLLMTHFHDAFSIT